MAPRNGPLGVQSPTHSSGHEARVAIKIGPLMNRVVVRSLEDTEPMRRGVFVPSPREKPQRRAIVTVGPGRFDEGKRASSAAHLTPRADAREGAIPW